MIGRKQRKRRVVHRGRRRSCIQLPPSMTTSGLMGQCLDQLAVRDDGERSPMGATGYPVEPSRKPRFVSKRADAD